MSWYGVCIVRVELVWRVYRAACWAGMACVSCSVLSWYGVCISQRVELVWRVYRAACWACMACVSRSVLSLYGVCIAQRVELVWRVYRAACWASLVYAPWRWSRTETCCSRIKVNFNENFYTLLVINSAFVGIWTVKVFKIHIFVPAVVETQYEKLLLKIIKYAIYCCDRGMFIYYCHFLYSEILIQEFKLAQSSICLGYD
jgi:hypothetical protein